MGRFCLQQMVKPSFFSLRMPNQSHPRLHKCYSIHLAHRGFAIISIFLWLTITGTLTGCSVTQDSDTLPTPGSGSSIIPESESWWQVLFTEPETISSPERPQGSIMENLIERINRAQQSIHVAAFEFDLLPVAEALIAAKQRGVEILWVTDDEYGVNDDPGGLFALLARNGIGIQQDNSSGLMHNKFLIFDGDTVWTGATNITENGIFHNNNNVLVIKSQPLARIFEREFDEMWEGQFGPTSPATVSSQSVTVEQTPILVLFASEDDVIDQLIPIIQGAQHNIRFMAFSFTDDALGNAVGERAKAGVNVMGIFETRGSETTSSELERLYCAQIAVRQDGNPSLLHHKVFVIDDEIVITGSMNFTDNADENNDENVIILANAEIAAAYLHEFELRWREARLPPKGTFVCQ